MAAGPIGGVPPSEMSIKLLVVYWYFLLENLRRPFPESDLDPGSPNEEPASAG